MSDPLVRYEVDMGTVCDLPKCTRQATHILTCHQIDHCKDQGSYPSGCKSFLLCPDCAKGIGSKIAERIQVMLDVEAQQNSILECKHCHMQITKLSQVLSVEHMLPMADA